MKKPQKNQAFKPGTDMLTANLLAMLNGWTAYGYDLVQRLKDAGFGEYNKGTVYRTLRHMEAMGLVSSAWDTSESGPARRMYSLTKAGALFLENWIEILDAHRKMLESFAQMTLPANAASKVDGSDANGEQGAEQK